MSQPQDRRKLGLEEVVYLVTHPEADPPEHFEDLVCHLREKGYDPGAFDPGELTVGLSGLTVRTAAKAARTRNGTRRGVQRLTSEDLEFCTCGRCQAGDPVRSVDGSYLTEAVPGDAEVIPVITLPPRTELAARARRVPLIDDALRLSCWQEAFEEELGTLDDMGGRVLPGMLGMLARQFDSVVFPVLKLLYRLPGEQWLDTGSLMSLPGADADGSGTSIGDVIVIESAARLMKILSAFGAADVDWEPRSGAAITLPPSRSSPAARPRSPATGCG
jgi:hypothetical protein